MNAKSTLVKYTIYVPQFHASIYADGISKDV